MFSSFSATKKVCEQKVFYEPCYCVYGVPQVEGISFDQSIAPVLEIQNRQAILEIGSSHALVIGITDVKNIYQNTVRPVSKQLYIIITSLLM